MKIKNKSFFKNGQKDSLYFQSWIQKLETANGYKYEKIAIDTPLGKTQVYGLNTKRVDLETLVIFPGFRTTSLVWDLDNGLSKISSSLRIFMVETNGQPNQSDGNTPSIKSLDYGHWANNVLNKLKIKKAYIAGASFGGLICMKFAITNPERIKGAFLLNAGCLQPFSMTISNLYYNLLPIIVKNRKNVHTFLNKAVFFKPNHKISKTAENLIVDYQLFSITCFKDKTEKPYYMKEELAKVKVDTFLIQGKEDILFPYKKSIQNAQKYLSNLKDIRIFDSVGHGIETFEPAIDYIMKKIVEGPIH